MRYRKQKTEYERAVEQQPPLSGRDRAILLTTGVVGMALAFTLEGVWQYKMDRLALIEPGTVAAVETAACFWMLPGFMLAFLMGLFGFVAIHERYALFGLPGTVYEGSDRKDVLGYPLFMDLTEAPDGVCRRVRKERRVMAGLLAAMVVSLIFAPMSWQGRASLHRDGTLRVYSGLGQVRDEFPAEELERLSIRITAPSGGKNGQSRYELELMVRGSDGKPWSFEEEKFASSDPEEFLGWLLGLKETLGPEVVRLENADRVNALIRDRGYSTEAFWLLYDLYGLRGQDLH